MQIFFAGAEVGTHLTLLKDCGVERVAVNISNLARNTSDLATWATHNRLDGLEWVLYADNPHVPVGPVLELLHSAEVLPEIITGPMAWYEGTWLSNSDLLFMPIWDGADPVVLREFTESFDGVTLTDSVVDNPTAVRTARASINRLGQLAALTGRSKGLERFDTLVSSAWWAVQKYGETQVWATNRLVRLNADDKRLKRERYAAAIDALGCDVSKVLLDDPNESVKCAVRSWLRLEQHIVKGGGQRESVVTSQHPAIPSNVVPIVPGVARPPGQTRHHLLPVMALGDTLVGDVDAEGNEIGERLPVISVKAESLRQCNTCALALACPMFSQNAACSYQIPVTISSRTQLNGVLRAITEIQTQRILMGRFSEEVQGEHNPDLGREMDRLFSMVERWRNIEDSRDTMKVSIEAKGDAQAGMGVLSRLFGAKVGQNATLLEEPIDSNEIIEEMTDDPEE